jgi:hypothetical protein
MYIIIITSHHPIHAPSNDMQMKRVNKKKQKKNLEIQQEHSPTHTQVDRSSSMFFSFQKIK